MNTRNIAIAFAAGIALGLLLMWFIRQPKDNSERLRKLEKDSASYVQGKEEQARRYALIDSMYHEAMDSLSLLSESTEGRLHDRPRRNLSLDPDSVLRRMRTAAGLPPAGLPPDLQYRRRGVRRQP